MQEKLGSLYSNGKRMNLEDWLLIVLATVIGVILAMITVVCVALAWAL